jgi:glycerol-3-phosphate dehydrogenase (NAD(P)+)
MARIVVVGAGAWGSALAGAWASEGHDVTLLSRRSDASAPVGAATTTDPAALRSAEIVVLAVTAQETRPRLLELAADIPATVPLVLTAKGLERETLQRQSQIAQQVVPANLIAVLSGPSLAADVGRGLPTAVTFATAAGGAELQAALATQALRIYLTDDVVGAEIGGAIKNVIAIACGIAIGAGYGESARAALMTRGLAEMTRLAVAASARTETLAGLSGLGDLALTCSSERSRNYRYGLALGRGDPPAGDTCEGVATAAAAAALAAAHGVETPIAEAVAAILEHGLTIDEAVKRLFARPLRPES